jgi:hypothetical protein
MAKNVLFSENIVVSRDEDGEKTYYKGAETVEDLDIDSIGETVGEYRLVRTLKVRRAIVEMK